jgi:hypothetical protein
MRKQLLVRKRRSMNSPRPTCNSISFPPLSCSVPSPPPSASGQRIRCTGTLPNMKDSGGLPSSLSYDHRCRRQRSPSPLPPPPPCGLLAPRFARSNRCEIKNYLCSMLRVLPPRPLGLSLCPAVSGGLDILLGDQFRPKLICIPPLLTMVPA